MKHINDSRTSDDWPRCGSWNQLLGDTLVVSALESDCADYRTAVNVGQQDQRGCKERPMLTYEPEPPLVDKFGDVVSRVKP